MIYTIKMQKSGLGKLFQLCKSLANDKALLLELIGEVEGEIKDNALKSILETYIKKINPEDLGVGEEITLEDGTVGESSIYDSPELGLKLFFLGKGGAFPLHDHPKMLVITCVIVGRVDYKCFDATQNPEIAVLAKKGSGKKGCCLYCTPRHMNLHSIVASQTSVILDIFLPNYIEEQHCRFYEIEKHKGKMHRIKETKKCFDVAQFPYLGLPLESLALI